MKFINKNVKGIFGVLTLALMFMLPFQTNAFSLGLDNNFDLNVKASDKKEIKSSSEVKAKANVDLVDEDYNYKEDERLPSGIKKAPGIEKHVEEDGWFPKGIWKKFFDHEEGDDQENDDDNEDVKVEVRDTNIEVVGTKAKIYFETNVETKGEIVYSKDSELNNSMSVDLNLDSEHYVEINDLDSDTKYYVKIILETEDGNVTYESDTRSFKTDELDNVAPDIMFYHVFNVNSDSTHVIWITSEKTSSKVWVSTNSEVDTSVEADLEDDELSFFHVFEIKDLEADTKYHIKVSGSDEFGNTQLSETLEFTTDL